jgi:hypothetical protein
VERKDYLGFIALVTTHIPNKGQVSLEGELASPFQSSLRSLPPFIGLRPATKRVSSLVYPEKLVNEYDVTIFGLLDFGFEIQFIELHFGFLYFGFNGS